MKALIIGVNSGTGCNMARVLAAMDIDLVLVIGKRDRLRESERELVAPVDIVMLDVSAKENCLALYQRFRNDSVDTLINSAGFGDFGEFTQTDLGKGLNMIPTNIQVMHILSRLFLRDFIKKDRGYTLSVAPSAVFLSGPLVATYHATKAYVERLTLAMHKELQKRSSHASISVLCPGSVQTEFDHVASVRFMMKGKTSMDVASYAIRDMSKEKAVMIPGILMRGSYLLRKCLPLSVQMETFCHIQHRKGGQTNVCTSK